MNIDSTIKEMITSKNLKYSRYRGSILDYMLKEKNHPSADIIYTYLKKSYPNMSFASVYNTLNIFRRTGLVRELFIQDGKVNYDADTSDHHHFICKECHSIYDYFDENLNQQIELKDTGHQIDAYSLTYFGICSACLENKK